MDKNQVDWNLKDIYIVELPEATQDIFFNEFQCLQNWNKHELSNKIK